MVGQKHRIEGKDVWFIERDRYYAFIAEHEDILIPRDNLPIQIKQFTDVVKVTTMDPEYAARAQPYRIMDQNVREGYLNKLGYPRDNFIKS
jgi:hypothetical protein